MKKQKNKINFGSKVSKKQKMRLQQQNADNELALQYFFTGLILCIIIAVIIMFVF